MSQTHFLFEEIIDTLSDALITVDQSRELIIWNKMAETMFGYNKSEMQRTGLEAIIPPAYRQRHREAYDRFVNEIESRASHVSNIRQFEALRKTGEIFPIELTHSLLKISNQEFYITATVRDISLRKHYEIVRTRFERITRHDLKTSWSSFLSQRKGSPQLSVRTKTLQLFTMRKSFRANRKDHLSFSTPLESLSFWKQGNTNERMKRSIWPSFSSLKPSRFSPWRPPRT